MENKRLCRFIENWLNSET